MTAVTTVTTPGETAALCASVGVSRASFYRRQRPAGPPRPRPARAAPPRALAPSERQAVLDVLHSDRFVDQSPAEVHATLLEQQTYLCSPLRRHAMEQETQDRQHDEHPVSVDGLRAMPLRAVFHVRHRRPDRELSVPQPRMMRADV